MTEDELVRHYPRLYHMAHDGAWPAIKKMGLLSASAMVDAYGISGDEADKLLRRHRPESVKLSAAGLPGGVLRDQKPMSDGALTSCLQGGLTPADWYERLNGLSFFWLSRERIWRLLKARAYRGVAQTVLTVDTAGLVAAHRDRILLSPINSGSTLFKPQPRGADLFKRIADFPFRERMSRPIENNVVELVVEEAVPDLAAHVLAVHRVRNDTVIEEVWRSKQAAENDGP